MHRLILAVGSNQNVCSQDQQCKYRQIATKMDIGHEFLWGLKDVQVSIHTLELKL